MSPPFVPELFTAAAAGDVAGASELVRRRLEEEPLETILTSLAAVQVEVGNRWAANRFTIVDEHRATAVVDAALAVVEQHLPAPSDGIGHVTLACAETEWHILPARLAATWLRLGGWHVDFLGGSLPSSALAADLARRVPDVVAVSCSVADQLFGARRTIAAAHGAGVPVAAGGAAFGVDDRRARTLGASAWAAGGAAIVAAVAEARAAGPAAAADPSLELRALEIVAHQDRLVSAAVTQLRQHFPAFLIEGTVAEAQTTADVRSIVRFAAATVLADDPSLFDEFIDWLVGILVVRGVPVSSLDAGLEAVLTSEPPEVAVPVLRAGRRRIPAAR